MLYSLESSTHHTYNGYAQQTDTFFFVFFFVLFFFLWIILTQHAHIGNGTELRFILNELLKFLTWRLTYSNSSCSNAEYLQLSLVYTISQENQRDINVNTLSQRGTFLRKFS